MNDHDLVRNAMHVADPATSTPSASEEVASVSRLVVADTSDGPDDPTVTRPVRRPRLAWASTAVAVAVVAMIAVVAIVPFGGSSDPGSVGSGGVSASDLWCDQQPLVAEAASESPADLRVFHTAELAYVLTALEVAPAEIRDELTILATDTRRIHDELEAAGWDATGVERSLSPDAQAAQIAIEEHRQAVCP